MKGLTSGRILWGLLLTAFGAVFLLNQLNVTAIDVGWLISHYWPVLLIYWGGVGALEALTRREGGYGRPILWGSVLINLVVAGLGVAALGNVNAWFSLDLSWIWKAIVPLVIVLAGVALLMGGARRPGARTYWAVMGGSKQHLTSWDDLAVVGIMGGTNLDFSQAGLPDRDVHLDLYLLMGGSEIRVPEGVSVTCEWTGIMGGVEVFGHGKGSALDHAHFASQGTGPRLTIRAFTLMGGAKVMQVPGQRQAIS